MVLAALVATLPLRWAAGIVLVCLPMSGTAVIMLGSDPLVLPLVVTGGFVVRHVFSLLHKPIREQFFQILGDNIVLLAFVGYCVISGLFFPRLFAGQTVVFPQSGFATTLSGAQVSVVQLVYLFMGMYLALALRHTILRRGLEFAVAALLLQAGLFAGFGMLQAMLGLAGVPLSTSWVVNNEGYSLLTSVTLGGFARVTSVFVEASSYAGWATGALAFCYGLYINRVLPTVTLGLLTLIGLTMILSTSSTAYGGLAIVGLFAMMFAFFDSDRARHERGFLIVLMGGFVAVAALLLVFSARDGLLVGLREMIEQMTLGKSRSDSGIERGMWAQYAIQNGLDTMLLGAGYGSLRSSGMLHQLFGSVGVPGFALFALFIGDLARRIFRKPRNGEDAVVSAGAFALCCTVGVQALSGNDLGLAQMFWAYVAIAGAPVAQRAMMRNQNLAERDAEPPARPVANTY